MARSKRITALANLTKGYQTVVDIGSDHGLVLKEAIDLGYVRFGIASDINEKPLKQAEKNLKGYPVKLIQSDGFLLLNEPFDLAIIAGMGAHTISAILSNAPKEEVVYLLQANDKIEVLRQYLVDKEFKIIDEYVVYDKFYYVILKVIRGNMSLDEKDIWLGPILKKKNESKPYYQFRLKQIKAILPKVKGEMKKRWEKIADFHEFL